MLLTAQTLVSVRTRFSFFIEAFIAIFYVILLFDFFTKKQHFSSNILIFSVYSMPQLLLVFLLTKETISLNRVLYVLEGNSGPLPEKVFLMANKTMTG